MISKPKPVTKDSYVYTGGGCDPYKNKYLKYKKKYMVLKRSML